jgi:DNA-binding GntR family transcriptional regulator
VRLTAHKRLLTHYSLLEQQIRVCIRSSDALIPDPAVIISQHQPILDAILSGDAAKSGRLAEDHNLSEGDKLAAHLAKQEQRAEAKPPSSGPSSRKRKM